MGSESCYLAACCIPAISEFVINVREVCGWITVVSDPGDLWGGCIWYYS